MSKLAIVCIAALLGLAGAVRADEASIRKNLAERLPNFPPIDEVSKTAIPGIYELRIGNDIIYTDENGHHVLQGQMIDTKTRANLTEARIAKLTQIDFASLPLKDAILIKQGSGARKVAVFGDPNCGYCKRLERDLVALKDVSIYTFLYPILGPDSNVKSRDIWCARDRAKAWRAWMVDGNAPSKASGPCDTSALERNVALGERHRVNGTPAIVFEDGTRSPGAMPADQIESRLVAAAKR
jgi:thiol:disulfide interchange protein DsbC